MKATEAIGTLCKSNNELVVTVFHSVNQVCVDQCDRLLLSFGTRTSGSGCVFWWQASVYQKRKTVNSYILRTRKDTIAKFGVRKYEEI